MKEKLLQSYAEAEKAVQIKFKHDPNPVPLGPGKIELVYVDAGAPLFKMLVPAMFATDRSSKPKQILLPTIFSADDVLFICEEPINVDGESAIVTPGGDRTPSGLHIPGRS